MGHGVWVQPSAQPPKATCLVAYAPSHEPRQQGDDAPNTTIPI